MTALILDSSLAAAWCFSDERTDFTNGVLQAIADGVAATSPRLWAYEIRNSVLTGMRRGRIGKADAQDFLDSIASLNIRLIDPRSYDALVSLAERHNLTVYDAAYLDLAMRESLPLASLDRALRQAALSADVSLFEL